MAGAAHLRNRAIHGGGRPRAEIRHRRVCATLRIRGERMTDDTSRLFATLRERYGDAPDGGETPGAAALLAMAAHRSHRRYTDRAVDPALLRTLCAVALSSPSKSDMQQRDIVIVEKPALRSAIADLVPS